MLSALLLVMAVTADVAPSALNCPLPARSIPRQGFTFSCLVVEDDSPQMLFELPATGPAICYATGGKLKQGDSGFCACVKEVIRRTPESRPYLSRYCPEPCAAAPIAFPWTWS